MHTISPYRATRTIFSVLLYVYALTATFSALCADEYDSLRTRWLETIVGPATFTIDSAITPKLELLATDVVSNGEYRDTGGIGYWDTLNTSPSTYLWSDLATSASDSAHITASYSRLKRMAAAYTTYGCVLKGNTALLNDIITGLEWLYANRYNENKTFYDNWWDWEIGTPKALNDIMVMLYPHLTTAQRAKYLAAINHFTPTPQTTGAANPMTGANLMWKCQVVGLSGILEKNTTKIAAGRDGVSPLFIYVTSGDGFYVDGSFIQHGKHPYNGGYGMALITQLLDFLYLFEGSTWEVSDPNQENVFTWLYSSFEPFIYKGELMDMVRGRNISRYDAPSHESARSLIGAFVRATQTASTSDIWYFKSVIKYWLQSDTVFSGDIYALLSIDSTILAQAIVGDTNVVSRGEIHGHFSYPGMARSLQLGTGWGAGLAMHSTRIASFERVNSENLKGWYTGTGMLYIYNADLLQFSENYWPTVNAYRLPGTTIEAGYAAPVQFSNASFVGGVASFDYAAGVAAMDISPQGRTLRGKKAWFFFDDEIVCLGSGITASGNSTLETVVENRRLTSAGSNTFLINGTARLLTLQTMPGTPGTITGASYAHLSGNVASSDIGYYFPGGVTLKGMRETRSGSWHDINQGPLRTGNTTVYECNYATLWFDHGVNPTAASYAYALLPNMTSAAVASYASAPEFSVLENSTQAQAVLESTQGNSIGAIFWENAVKTVGTGTNAITSSEQAAVFAANSSELLNVGVADPTQLNTGTINLEFARSATSVASNDPRVDVTQLTPTIKLSVNANDSHGLTQRVSFNLGNSGTELQAQCETLVSRASGASEADFSDTNLSGGRGNRLNATTATGNPYVEYDVVLPSSGTWNIQVALKKHPTYGIFQTSIVQSGADVGGSKDAYSSGATYETVDLGNYSFSSSGTKTFRFRVISKNASSSNYWLAFDYIKLAKQ
jgi:hyaluronate lyase